MAARLNVARGHRRDLADAERAGVELSVSMSQMNPVVRSGERPRSTGRPGPPDELVVLGTITPQAPLTLEEATIAGLNVIIARGTQAGKTTLDESMAENGDA